MRLNTKNQLPRLPQTTLNVMIPGVVVWWCGFLTDYKTTPTKVVLSCFGLSVGLWQFNLILVFAFQFVSYKLGQVSSFKTL